MLNIETHANFGKDVLLPLGAVWSHPKGGELVFDDQGSSCEVSSNGHPADVVLSDLVKVFSNRVVNMKENGNKTAHRQNGITAAPADPNNGFQQLNK